MITKKIFGLLFVCGAAFLFTGCDAVRNYSIRSYQGPMPLKEYQYMNTDSYGAPMARK